MVFTLSIYINCSKIEEANEALKIAASGRKYYSLLPKNKQRHRCEKKQKLQTCLTSLKDGLVEC
jgi:hypothetical protein